MHAAYGGTRILIRGRSYCAGIEDDNFRIGRLRSTFQPTLLELAFESGTVCLSRPATKILYVESRHSTIVATFEGMMSAAVRRLRLPLPRRCAARSKNLTPLMLRRVLLVDDDLSVLLSLKAVLELHSFDVETAVSVAEAQRKLAANAFELVVTDVRMEREASGMEVLRLAASQSYRPATAVLTAYLPRHEQWKNEPVDAVLVKPMGTRELVQQLENLLTRRKSKHESRPPD
jgi:CheY-like chemotaxis protein